MTDPSSSDPQGKPKFKPGLVRIIIWVFVGGVGLYLIISGITGIGVKGL